MTEGNPSIEALAAQRLAALGNRTRLRLFRLLVQAGRDGLNVGELQRHLDVPASTLAHHLAILTRADLIVQTRHGREVISSANYDAMNALIAYMSDQCCVGVALDSTSDAA